jgi:MFS family permease
MALFAMADRYAIAVLLLFVAGFAELTSNATAQTIVQTTAPLHIRGRVIGLFNMAALGLRFGSGLMVGVLGGWLGIHGSLVAACLSFVVFLLLLQVQFKKSTAA